jgi:peptidoglycan hydrolase-like protein with peptidoglycan-binding domain
MKNLSLTFCLVIAALLASVGSGFAGSHLPKCPESPWISDDYNSDPSWHNCIGTFLFRTWAGYGTFVGEYKNGKRHGQGTMTLPGTTDWPKGTRYVGGWKNGSRHGQGIYYYSYGKIEEGVWKNDKFQYAQKTPYSRKPSVLRTAFIKLSKENRRQLQTNLKDLGFYKSSIDGLYGKGTAGALADYNKQNLNGADLKKSKNVEKLFNVVLGLKPSPTVIPESKPKVTTDFQPTPEIEPTTKVEPKLVPKVQPKPKPKRDLEKEFGLSLYGSFLHSEKVPNALFFFDKIEQNDNFEFRKALRNHDVDLIVLSSPGGLVWEGLSIAGIINDKGFNVYVPKSSVKGDGNCASACSFMFFAGATRNVEGKLGVHQFLSKDSKKKEEVGDIQKTAQFTVSEIIGFLNVFETPAWVYERMFQQSDMYYFKETELVQLETEVSDELAAHYEKSEKFITDLSKAFAEVAE